VPDDWTPATVPLSSLVRATGAEPTRLVLFRRPIEHRCESRSELEAMVLTVVVEQVAELLGIDAELVDPRYEPRDD
jgi:predicted Zn-dependent protease with MMP-like domain